MLRLRPEVREFAEAMERKLRKNDAERGNSWKISPMSYLLERLEDEVRELRNAILDGNTFILPEAADVGNFVMMIIDRYDELLVDRGEHADDA